MLSVDSTFKGRLEASIKRRAEVEKARAEGRLLEYVRGPKLITIEKEPADEAGPSKMRRL